MPRFIRHCVECPKCQTRYLLAFSPYANGACLVLTATGSVEEYILYCSCRQPPVPSRWRGSELKKYAVSKAAHRRGYGTTQEVVPVEDSTEKTGAFPATRLLDVNPGR